MLKNTFKLGIAGIVGMCLAVAAPNHAKADYPTKGRNYTPMKQTVLEPGWKSSCDTNFVIENLGVDPAEVIINLGKDGKVHDVVQSWDKRGYDLAYHLSFAKQLGKTVNIDDVALIENLS